MRNELTRPADRLFEVVLRFERSLLLLTRPSTTIFHLDTIRIGSEWVCPFPTLLPTTFPVAVTQVCGTVDGYPARVCTAKRVGSADRHPYNPSRHQSRGPGFLGRNRWKSEQWAAGRSTSTAVANWRSRGSGVDRKGHTLSGVGSMRFAAKSVQECGRARETS